MMFHHHHARFGFLVAVFLLSLGLGSFIYFTAHSDPTPSSAVSLRPPTADEYRASVRPVVDEMQRAYGASKDLRSRQHAVETALEQLLDIRVPAEEKDVHLELALSLQMVRVGLVGDQRQATEGWERFLALVQSTPWLHAE